MKKILFLSSLLCSVCFTYSQTYPEPEFSNEVYYLNKANGNMLIRLEKNSSKMDQKTNMISGSELSYSIEGVKSPVRLSSQSNLSFVFSTGASSGKSSVKSDSMMKANGIDPSTLSGFGDMTNPSERITLYKMETGKGGRKIIYQKAPGMNPFGSHKLQSSDKYTFSAKKIRDGYWELIIDKTLPKGEYTFSMSGMGMDAASGGTILFAFGID